MVGRERGTTGSGEGREGEGQRIEGAKGPHPDLERVELPLECLAAHRTPCHPRRGPDLRQLLRHDDRPRPVLGEEHERRPVRPREDVLGLGVGRDHLHRPPVRHRVGRFDGGHPRCGEALPTAGRDVGSRELLLRQPPTTGRGIDGTVRDARVIGPDAPAIGQEVDEIVPCPRTRFEGEDPPFAGHLDRYRVGDPVTGARGDDDLLGRRLGISPAPGDHYLHRLGRRIDVEHRAMIAERVGIPAPDPVRYRLADDSGRCQAEDQQQRTTKTRRSTKDCLIWSHGVDLWRR